MVRGSVSTPASVMVRVAAAEAAIQAIEQAQHHMGEGRSDADLYTDAGVRALVARGR